MARATLIYLVIVREKSNNQDFDPDILQQLWCIRYLLPLDLSTKTTTNNNKKPWKAGIFLYSNVKILKSEKEIREWIGGDTEFKNISHELVTSVWVIGNEFIIPGFSVMINYLKFKKGKWMRIMSIN